MKAFLKRLIFFIFLILFVGGGVCAYLLQAPPVEQKATAKLQIHTRTALRGRPSVDSKPIVYTKDVYRFSMEPHYISNLNSGKLEMELLFSATLAHRATFNPERLDTALGAEIDWAKMFTRMTEDIRFQPDDPPIEVLLSGKEWRLRDAAGAAYRVVKNGTNLDVYIPDLREAFEANQISLSPDLEVAVKEKNQRWLITDTAYEQAYSIVKGDRKLNVFQQSKFEILTRLFGTDIAYQDSLAEGHLPRAFMQDFETHKFPLSRRARVSAHPDGMGWQISSPPLKYNVHPEAGRLKVYLDLKSDWLLVRVDDSTKGWVQSSRGTLFEPPIPTLTSRQQAKARLLVLIDDLKARVAGFRETAPQ